MKQKDYWKPTMKVVQLRHQVPILAMSENGVNLQGAGVDEAEAEDNGTNIWQ